MNGVREPAEIISELRNCLSKMPPERLPSLIGDIEGIKMEMFLRIAAPGQDSRNGDKPERLLSTKEAAEILQVTPRWLYKKAAKLSFARRLSRRKLLFEESGLKKWMARQHP